MPAKPSERQYRSLAVPLNVRTADGSANKRFDTDYYVEGYASTFNDPYVLFTDWDGNEYREIIDPGAFDGADMSDVIMQYDHEGRVFARQSNKTLILQPDYKGLKVAADLGKTDLARGLYQDIEAGMGVKKYEDNDTDDQITKGIMLVDGKVVDKNSLVVVKKIEAV